MTDQDLSDSIEALIREIDSLDEDDLASREQLRALADTLKERLARHAEPDASGLNASVVQVDDSATDPGDRPSSDPGDLTIDPGDNAILEIVAAYEARYPKQTAMLNEIMTRLASMGI